MGAILSILLISTAPFSAMMHQLLEVSGPGFFLQNIARRAVEGKHSEATQEVRMLDASNMIESCSTEVNKLLAAGEFLESSAE